MVRAGEEAPEGVVDLSHTVDTEGAFHHAVEADLRCGVPPRFSWLIIAVCDERDTRVSIAAPCQVEPVEAASAG